MADHANFQWPWQYNFPPFFTIQPNLDTRKKQLEAWRSLILNYHRAKKLYVLDVTESHSSPLFCNKAINRKLNLDSVLLVLEDLRQKGNLEWLDKQRKSCYIYWRTPEEWAKHIYRYVSDNGMVNTVCTLYELKNGEDTLNQEFHGIDDGILVRALRNLEMDKKAELISFDGNEGVKFF